MTPAISAPPPRSTRTLRGPHWRVATLTGATLVLLGSAAIALAASPEPSATADPDVTVMPDRDGHGARGLRGPFLRGLAGLPGGFAGFAGRHSGFAAGNITITAINGSSVSLETADGWTRTITVTGDTKLTRDGDEITLSDLKVGDHVRFRQTVDDNGTWAVTAIAVISPSVFGQVTAVGADTITLSQPDGSSVTVHVDSSTTFTVGGQSGKTLSDVEVGMIVGASGDERSDGSLDATRVRAGSIWDRVDRGRGHMKQFAPDAAPSAAPEQSSTSAG